MALARTTLNPWTLAAAVAALFVSLVWIGDVRSEGKPKLTPERLHADPPLDGRLPTGAQWHPDGRRVSFLRGDALWTLDPASGEATLLLDPSRIVLPDRQAPLPLRRYRWVPGGDSLLLAAEGDLFLVDARTGAGRRLTQTPEPEEFPEPSPDGKRIAFVRSHDLYLVDAREGRETRLTRSGSSTVLNGRLDWVYEEELADRNGKAYSWSPDSKAVAFLQLDQSRVPTFPIVDFLRVHNETTLQRYPKAGDPNSVVRLGVVDVSKKGEAGPERFLSFAGQDLYVVPDLVWTPDSRAVAFQELNREQTELRLRLLPVPGSPDEALGAKRTLLTERDPHWINVLSSPRFLKDGRRFVWTSERDGFAHLHLCEPEGSCRPMTQGPWLVDRLLAVDERTSFAYFTATEKDPRERHLYRVRLDGTGRARISREDGTHNPVLSPDLRYYVDTLSDLATPPRIALFGGDGARRSWIEENADPPILKYETAAWEWVDVRTRDGLTLHGRLLKPADFRPDRRYPVVVYVYGGPHSQVVRNAWPSSFFHLLASRGFLVWSLDNRGSAGRGHAFETPLHRSLGRVELEDQLAGISHLRTLPYVDPDRLGICGWSYGGYMTLYAMTHAPGVFRAGVAGAPVTDWKFYDTIYTERYMGTPQSNPAGYASSSPLERAAKLEGELLILHGTGDDNVHFAHTVAFANALILAGRLHTTVVLPGEGHGLQTVPQRVARDATILRHFETHLKR